MLRKYNIVGIIVENVGPKKEEEGKDTTCAYLCDHNDRTYNNKSSQ